MNIRNNASETTDVTDAPTILEKIIHEAEHAGASDVHLQMREKTADVSFRLDGVLAPAKELPSMRNKFIGLKKCRRQTV